MKNLIRFKKSITLAIGIACLVCIQAVSNYSTAAEPAFDQGSNTIALGVGFGLGYGYYSGATTSPALTFSYDHGFFPEVGPGTIGIGGIIAYKSASYDYGYKGYKAKWTNTIVAVRGTYHFTGLAEKIINSILMQVPSLVFDFTLNQMTNSIILIIVIIKIIHI